MFNDIGEAAMEFLRHEEGLAGAAPRWVESSQLALADLAVRWVGAHGYRIIIPDISCR